MREEVFICIRNKNRERGENVKVVTFLFAFYVIRFILHKLFSPTAAQTELTKEWRPIKVEFFETNLTKEE